MPRKQAKRRNQNKQRKIQLPVIPSLPMRRIGISLIVVTVVALCYQFSLQMLDRPIASITIEGSFQRVTALQLEEAVSNELRSGFFTADLKMIRSRIIDLDWIDDANVTRRWPSTLAIAVTEQIPAARWGASGLLNTRGDLFVPDARHVPAELPKLNGPEGQSTVVAKRYLNLRERLIPIGLDVREVTLDARGAWEIILNNGIEIRFGRRDIVKRTRLFLEVAAGIISSREAEIAFVDLRYSNGFTIGWKNGSRSPVQEKKSKEDGMVAGLET